ncbi:MAG: hypothetical protein ABGX16_16015 [Pirellulales bacterium]
MPEQFRIKDILPLEPTFGTDYCDQPIRVPMFARWPGVTRAGTVCTTPIFTVDFLPTLSEIAGAENASDQVSQPCDGISFLAQLRGQEAARGLSTGTSPVIYKPVWIREPGVPRHAVQCAVAHGS